MAACSACVVATSACASSHAGQNTSSTDAIQLHQSGYNALPLSLQSFIRSALKDGPPDGPVREIDVYGPGSRAALVKASSGDIVKESPGEQKGFYLIVLHGHFVCAGCTGPVGAKPPHGTVETRVWSRAEGGTDFGIQNGLPTAVSQLHRLATIQLS